jgi:hypothetical protein
MQTCETGYALIYVTTLKLQLIIGLTADKFKPLIFPILGFSLSITMYIWICMV